MEFNVSFHSAVAKRVSSCRHCFKSLTGGHSCFHQTCRLFPEMVILLDSSMLVSFVFRISGGNFPGYRN